MGTRFKKLDPILPVFRTGYFGIPGTFRTSLVHVVDATKRNEPICGTTLGPEMEFQWCANRIYLEYITCEHCRRIAHRIATEMYK